MNKKVKLIFKKENLIVFLSIIIIITTTIIIIIIIISVFLSNWESISAIHDHIYIYPTIPSNCYHFTLLLTHLTATTSLSYYLI